MAILTSVLGWFGRFGSLGEKKGSQAIGPSVSIIQDATNIGTDGALQISTVWGCVERRALVVSSLPLFAYSVRGDGQKDLARSTRLYDLLHNSPNSRMTPLEFWRAMMLNHDLLGNAYARIDRDAATGEALAMWPMPSDQVTAVVLADGSMVYEYTLDGNVAVLAADNVLHLKGLGNGTTGLSKLQFMRPTTNESVKAQQSASAIFGSGGKPTGLLMIDRVLSPAQREALRDRFAGMATGSISRLFVLEADLKYQQLSISPEDQQLLATRRFSVEEICRWLDVPPVLVHHYDGVTYNGSSATIESWYKTTIRPMLVSIEQAVTKRVLTPRQRATMAVEFSFEALLRGDPAARATFYSTALQNGYMTRNEVRQLENLPPDAGAGAKLLTAQSNLLPLDKLGTQTGGTNAPAQDAIAQ